MKDRQRGPVLIVGAHRSGTSATARALQILGLQIGQQLDSHYEPRELQKLQEEYFRRTGAAWHNPRPFLEKMNTAAGRAECANYLRANVDQRFAKIFGYRANPTGLWLRAKIKFGRAWGWKEPRTTLLAESWLEIFPQGQIVHVLRDVDAAASSIRERELKFQAAGDLPTGNLASLDYCRALVRDYAQAAERLQRSAPYQRIRFEEIQANPRLMLQQLGEFCGLRPTPGQLAQAAASIQPAHIHASSI